MFKNVAKTIFIRTTYQFQCHVQWRESAQKKFPKNQVNSSQSLPNKKRKSVMSFIEQVKSDSSLQIPELT